MEALKWFRLAAESGDVDAQQRVGAIHANGLGVPQDDVEALKWYRLAAERGHTLAQVGVGSAYLSGKGVRPDQVRGYMWVDLAAAAGDAEAEKIRERLVRSLTPTQLAEAKQLARACQERKFKGCD